MSARRGGLLHDIGKALSHEREGAHAVIGAEIARRCGETEVVANAIGAHHNDEQAKTAIAHVVTAADALSGGRPGARRESVMHFMEHVADLESLARHVEGVEDVHIMHAGREVVLRCGDQEVSSLEELLPYDEDRLISLAQKMAGEIETRLSYPGQIRITATRELRAVAVAR